MDKSKRDEVLSIRIPRKLKDKIDGIADATTRRRSDLLIRWITDKVEQEEWQLQQINEGLADLDASNFATAEQLNRLKKYGFGI